MRKRTESRLVDEMISAYVDWREACRAVHAAYCSWATAAGRHAGVAYSRFNTALDAEERAAEIYAGLVQRVGQVGTSNRDLSGPLAA